MQDEAVPGAGFKVRETAPIALTVAGLIWT